MPTHSEIPLQSSDTAEDCPLIIPGSARALRGALFGLTRPTGIGHGRELGDEREREMSQRERERERASERESERRRYDLVTR